MTFKFVSMALVASFAVAIAACGSAPSEPIGTDTTPPDNMMTKPDTNTTVETMPMDMAPVLRSVLDGHEIDPGMSVPLTWTTIPHVGMFRVLKNSTVLIETPGSLSFTDFEPSSGPNAYQVLPVAMDGSVGIASNTVTVTVKVPVDDSQWQWLNRTFTCQRTGGTSGGDLRPFQNICTMQHSILTCDRIVEMIDLSEDHPTVVLISDVGFDVKRDDGAIVACR